MSLNPQALVDWRPVKTVLLDMDGTLLDLHYDSHFWREHLPLRYAAARGIDVVRARAELTPRLRAAEGSLDWYCIDYWTHALGLDIALLKEEVAHLIAVHPDVFPFLDAVRAGGRRAVLVTNAHRKSLALKLARTDLGEHLDAIVCAHDLGAPKEAREFWERLLTAEPFDPERTLLIDDNLAALRAAARYGIAQLLSVYQPDSRQAPNPTSEFAALRGFREIIPSDTVASS